MSPKIDIDEGAGDHTIELPLGEVALADRMRTDAVGTPCLVVLGGLDLGASLLLDIPEVVVGRDPECHHVLSDDGISRRHASFTWNGRGYDITDLDSTNGVFVNGERVTTATLREGDKILLGQSTVLKYTRQDDFELEYQRRLHESLSRDALTGAMNRRFLEERLLSEWSFAMRHGTQLSLLVLDVDHFKRVNDTHGHPTGDAVLKGIVEAIGSTIRKEDVLGRYGGEEFVVIVRGVGHDGALRLARRIRASIASARFVHGRTLIPVTVSIGVATAAETSGESHEKLLALADERLFEAKRSGRDRVVG